MNSYCGKILTNLFIWIALINLTIMSFVVIADNDFDRSNSAKAQEWYGYVNRPKLYVTKKLSEFLGGPGKRSDQDESYYLLNKRLSEFLGGPGRKRSIPQKFVLDKKYSEFLGGPGK